MTFDYTARSKTGERISDSIDADDKIIAIRAIERLGHVPISVAPRPPHSQSSSRATAVTASATTEAPETLPGHVKINRRNCERRWFLIGLGFVALCIILAIGVVSGYKPSNRTVKRVVLEYLDAARRLDTDTTTRLLGGPNRTFAGNPMDLLLECQAYAASGWTLAVDKTTFKRIKVKKMGRRMCSATVTVDMLYQGGRSFMTKKDRDFVMEYKNGIWQIVFILPVADTRSVTARPL